ncbi:nucleotide-diphospho-sugar transferase [Serendipita vermifera]|nr:nucleotide-diphospho-sugar transferase [Serendipita vermifera]
MCNAPLLDWTFESLAVAGVNEVFVMCQSHFESIEEAIRKSKWSQPTSPLKIHAKYLPPAVKSFGDAIRQVDAQSIITGDFVLVSGDMVCNVRIDEMVKIHKERRKVDKEVIMTVLVKEADTNHRTRPKGENAIFTLDADTKECLHYEGVPAVPKLSNATIPKALLKGHELEVRYDLIDCGIDVCSADVPLLFQEIFHSNDLRRDFMTEILTSDILDKKVFCHFASDGYAARVRDPRTYAAVSRDILGRWCFPLVPDDSHPGGHQYEHLPGNRYLAKDKVILSRNCKVGSNTLIGPGSRLNDTAKVEGSVLGENCIISGGVMIRNSYLWDNVSVGAGSIIKESILSSGVIVETGVVIERGCLIGENVTLRAYSRIAEFSKIAKTDEPDPEGNNAVLLESPAAGGEESDEEEDDDPFESAANLKYLRLGGVGHELSESDTEPDTSGTEGDDDNASVGSRGAGGKGEVSNDPWISLRWKDEFGREAYQTLKRGIDENIRVEDIVLELKTLRMANNADMDRVKLMVVAFLLKQMPIVQGGAAEQKQAAKQVFGTWGKLISILCQGELRIALLRLQTICAETEYFPTFGSVVSVWFMEEIVDEDVIEEWHALPDAKGTEGSNTQKLWKIGQSMLAALAQDSDEEEETSEEEDDSDEEENNTAVRKAAPTASGAMKPTVAKRVEEESDEEDDDDDDDNEEEEKSEEEEA